MGRTKEKEIYTDSINSSLWAWFLFVPLSSVYWKEWGKVKKCSSTEIMPQGRSLLCWKDPRTPLLYRKNVNAASPFNTGISFPALNTNGARFPFTSRKRHRSMSSSSTSELPCFQCFGKDRSLLLISNLFTFLKIHLL